MAAFAWPICVCLSILIFAVFFVHHFRKELGHFIERTKRITKQGVEAGPAEIAIQEVNAIANPSPADDLLRAFDNQLLLEQEGLITRHLEENKIQSPSERARVLTRYLAASYIVVRFESIYQTIWGSQLRALEMLNQTPEGLPLAALEPWYELGRAMEPGWYNNYALENWYGFLEGGPLVVNKAGTVYISVLGKEFLKYLIDCGHAVGKPG
jgi:hypothetical protein